MSIHQLFPLLLVCCLCFIASFHISEAVQDCAAFPRLARAMNYTKSNNALLVKECMNNKKCTGINCRCRFRKTARDPLIPSHWLLPFCYSFQILNCAAPVGVLVKIKSQNQANPPSYYHSFKFFASGIRPLQGFGTHTNAVDVQLYINVTFYHQTASKSVTFGMFTAVKLSSHAFGHFERWPDWAKQELVPLRDLPIAKCTSARSSTRGDACEFVQKIPIPEPTKTPEVLGKCKLDDISPCRKNEMCIPAKKQGSCVCAIDAVYIPTNHSCVIPPKRPNPTPTTIPDTTTAIMPTPKSVPQTAAKPAVNLGLYIGIPVAVLLLLVIVGGVGLFLYRRSRAVYDDREILMQSDVDDVRDDDDRPLSI